MDEYENKCPEELRCEDYLAGRKVGGSQPQQTGDFFGAIGAAPTLYQRGLFHTRQHEPTEQNKELFGPGGLFGAPTSSTGSFCHLSAATAFGHPSTATFGPAPSTFAFQRSVPVGTTTIKFMPQTGTDITGMNITNTRYDINVKNVKGCVYTIDRSAEFSRCSSSLPGAYLPCSAHAEQARQMTKKYPFLIGEFILRTKLSIKLGTLLDNGIRLGASQQLCMRTCIGTRVTLLSNLAK
jgi:hypothetical protein